MRVHSFLTLTLVLLPLLLLIDALPAGAETQWEISSLAGDGTKLSCYGMRFVRREMTSSADGNHLIRHV